jgi:uncharacterized membrane protein
MLFTVLIWWLTITLLGLAALPLAFWLFERLPMGGLGFARPLGLLLVSYLLWLGASCRILPNNLAGMAVAALLLVLLAGWQLWRPDGCARALLARLRAQRGTLLVGELLFACALLGWTLLRVLAAEKILPTGGEKFMEMAFLNSILRSPTFPPPDPWLAGHTISYYYFGYVMLALLTSLTQTPATSAFDLYDALLLALTCQAAYTLASEMAALSAFRRVGQTLAGLCAALFSAGIGNLEGLLEALAAHGWLPPGFAAWLAVPGFPLDPANDQVGWWWWRASRVIQDLDLTGKPIAASPISEFPFFSFLLGDNHPHVLALPFALLAAGIALAWITSPQCLSRLRLSLAALCIGALVFLNTWDYPVYFTLALAACFFSTQDWRETARRGLWLAGGAALFYLPFLLSFKSQAGGLLPYIFPPTRLPQYALIFGPFLLILSGFLLFSLSRRVPSSPAATLRSEYPWRIHPTPSPAPDPLQGGEAPQSACHTPKPLSSPIIQWREGSEKIDEFQFANSIRDVAQFWLRIAAILASVILLTSAALGLFFYFDQRTGGATLRLLQPVLGSADIPQILFNVLAARIRDPWLFLLLSLLLAVSAACLRALRSQPDPAQRFAILLTILGLVLTFSTEFFYLRDNFGVRMNTIFKFYFQAWILLACASAYALAWMVRAAGRPEKKGFLGYSRQKVPDITHHQGRTYALAGRKSKGWVRFFIAAAACVLIAAGLTYPLRAIPSRISGWSTPLSLDATAALRRANPADWAGIDWLQQQPSPAVLLEAPCPAYCYGGRMSAFSGIPAVLGWVGHETQWRGGSSDLAGREPDINRLYTSASDSQTLDLLRRWQVTYVILGDFERSYIRAQCTAPACSPEQTAARFARVLSIAFQQDGLSIYHVPR